MDEEKAKEVEERSFIEKETRKLHERFLKEKNERQASLVAEQEVGDGA